MSTALSAIVLALGFLTRNFGWNILGMALIIIATVGLIISAVIEYRAYKQNQELTKRLQNSPNPYRRYKR